nr:hypothetical protein [Tanacetum cinerariifolium]
MSSLTSMCEMACQIVQKKQEEKRIEEEQVANARYWNIPAFCDDDDDYNYAITPVLSTEGPDNSLSMRDEHLDTISATESDEVIKSSVEDVVPIPSESEDEVIKFSVEDLVPIPSESEGIPDTMCDVHLVNNPTPLDAKDLFEIVINSNDDYSSSDDDSLYNENIEYVEASPHDSKVVSLVVAEIVIPKDEEIEDDNLHEKLLNVNLLIAKIEALKDNPTSSFEFLTKSSSTSPKSFLKETNTFDNSLPKFENFCFDLEEISSGSTTAHSDISLLDYEAFYFYDDHIEEISSGSTTTHSDISLSEYDSNSPDQGEWIPILNSRIRENLSSTTRVNLPVEDDHSPLLAYVADDDVIISIPPLVEGVADVVVKIKGTEKQEEKQIEEEQAANARYWKIPACCDDDDYNSAITPNEPVESLSIPDTMCDVHLVNNPTPLEAKDHFEIVINSNYDYSSSDDDSLYNENIEYVEASPHDSEVVSLEVAEIVIPEDEEIDDDNLCEKLLNVNLLIAKIEALKDNPTPSSEFLTKYSSTSPKSFLEETNTFDNSLPKFENFCFDLEEISSGSTTTHSDISLSDYEAFYFYDDHIEEISSGSTTTHSDISLSDSFIFDLSNDQFPLTDRSYFTHEEFADELAHITSPLEYDCFYFRNFPDQGEWIPILNSGIRENLSSTTRVNLPVEDDHSPLLAYVVWILLAYLAYPVIPPYLDSFGNEDTIFDPGIAINRFYSFKLGVSHRCGTFKKFNTHRSHLNESPMEILLHLAGSQPMLKSSYKAEDDVIISIPLLVGGVADMVVEIKGTEHCVGTRNSLVWGILVKDKQEKDKIRTKPDKNGKHGRARQCQSPVTVKKAEKEKKIQSKGTKNANPRRCIKFKLNTRADIAICSKKNSRGTANDVRDFELASLFGKLKYEENIIDSIYDIVKKSLTIATPLLTAFISTSIGQDFQDSPDDKEDTRSSQEYMKDLEMKFHERALLEKSKRFFKKGANRVKVLMALIDVESGSVGKESVRNGKWVKISMRKDTNVSKLNVGRPWLFEAEGFNLPNYDTGRILSTKSHVNVTKYLVTVNITESSVTEYDSAK